MRSLLATALALVLAYSPLAWGCAQYPHAPPDDLLIERNFKSNGLLYLIYDLDQDLKRDYGLAFQTGCKAGEPPHFACEWPLFYLLGDAQGVNQVYIDVGNTMGLCENIRLYWSAGEPLPKIQAQVSRFFP